MRICLMGAVASTLVTLEALVRGNRAPALVVTLPPEAAERHSDFSDLATPARAAGAAIHYTANANAPGTIDALAASAPDLTMVVGWSQICREAFRGVARIGTLGYHPAPLPRFRGRAVIPWTILAGETTSGSTLFWLDEGVDSGPVIAQRVFPVSTTETARTLYDKHMLALADLVVEALDLIEAGNGGGRVQDEARASYCARRTPADGRIDWREGQEAVLRLIRAVGDPYPGAFTGMATGKLTIDAAHAHAPAGRYIGMPGQVQTHTQTGFTVLCGDGATIEVTRWHGEGGGRPKVHTRLD